ncbi:MAG: PDZ domain-containing protein [Planctomycetaceae bacterium]|nr:PDZ domain-containing protein [Planctomycetaceae bacterium]
MKISTRLFALGGLCAAAALPAYAALRSSAPASVQLKPATSGAPQGRLMRAAPLEPLTQEQIAVWKKRLAQEDLDLREQAFDLALDAALRDGGLRSALESWAKDTSAPELAWTARLVLRELRERQDPLAAFGGQRALQLDPLAPGFGPGIDFDTLRRRMFEDLGLVPGLQNQGTPLAPAQPSIQAQSESFSLESGPDGVKCKVTKSVDGKEVTEEYEAKTIEELLEAHPELRERVGGNGMSFRFGTPLGSGAAPTDPFGWLTLAPSVRTDILGVAVTSVSAEESGDLGLEPGLGLRVERVEPGTIAQQLGLQRGHVLIELNGRKLRTRDDITEMLKARDKSGALELLLIDRWGQRRTRTWKPDDKRQA